MLLCDRGSVSFDSVLCTVLTVVACSDLFDEDSSVVASAKSPVDC